MRKILFFVILNTMASISFADLSIIEPYEYGIFQTTYQNAKEGERIISSNNQKIEQTTQIPAKLGTKFGVRYRLSHKSSGGKVRVKLLYLTPGIIDPKTGIRHDKFEVIQELSPDAGFHLIAFEFTENYEIIPGKWDFYVFVDDTKLLEQHFDVMGQ